MKINTLHEDGFQLNPHRPPDRAKHAETLGARDALFDVVHNTRHYNISIISKLLTSIMGTLSQIIIDSPYEKRDIERITDELDKLRVSLAGLPENDTPPDDILSGVSTLARQIDIFCLRYAYRRPYGS